MKPSDTKYPAPFDDPYWFVKGLVYSILDRFSAIDHDDLVSGKLSPGDIAYRIVYGRRDNSDDAARRNEELNTSVADSAVHGPIQAGLVTLLLTGNPGAAALDALGALVLAPAKGIAENQAKYLLLDNPDIVQRGFGWAWEHGFRDSVAPYTVLPRAGLKAWDRVSGSVRAPGGVLGGGGSWASGGLVTGAGSGVSDSVPAWLSNGEWVVRAGAVDALGQDVLGMLNQWDQLSADQRAVVGGALSGSSAAGVRGGGLGGAVPSSPFAVRLSGGGPVGGWSPFSAMGEFPGALMGSLAGVVAAVFRSKQEDEDAAAAAELARQQAADANNVQRALLGGQITSMNSALVEAQKQLRAAQQAFDDYNSSVAAGVRVGTDFATALGAQSKAQGVLTDAVKTQTDAQKALAVAKASGTDAQIASATRALAEADQKVAAAKDETGGFLSFLQKGAESAAAFATQIDNLRAAGASSDVVQKIAQLGAASGGSAAGELLAGGSSSIAQANYLVQLVADLSNKTGLAAAKQYYGPALDAAQSSVNSITAQLAALQASFDAIPKQAEGGIVTRATLAVVGEAGPEAIIPLNRVGALGSSNAINVSLTVHGSVVQENDLVVSVRDGIAQLMRRRGLDPSIIGV